MRIFVVDDEKIIVDTLTLIFTRGGFPTEGFDDPRKAFRAALIEAPDLLISDVMMPSLSGVDLAIQLKGVCPRCEILLMSGQADTNDLLREARKLGFHFKLLAKPIAPSDFLTRIKRIEVDMQLQKPEQASVIDPSTQSEKSAAIGNTIRS